MIAEHKEQEHHMNIEYSIPARYGLDALSRGIIPESAVVRINKNSVRVTLDKAQRAEVISDCYHYANDFGIAGDPDLRGLIQSAKSTGKTIAGPFWQSRHLVVTLETTR